MFSLPPTIAGRWPAIDADGFGQPLDAFPVETPFSVRPDLVKLLPADDWLRVDRQWPEMLAAKLAVLAGSDGHMPAGNVMLGSACAEPVARRRLVAVRRACERLAASPAGRRLGIGCGGGVVWFAAAGYRATLHPSAGAPADAAAGPPVRHDDCGLSLQAVRPDAAAVVQSLSETGDAGGALRLLGALAMSLQEDLVLMEQADDGAVRAALFHVSFPSAWDPARKLGQDLLALHAPVADNASLQAAAARLGQALVAKGPFVRWVWTVTEDARWRAWPPLPGDESGEAGARPLYFRLERQTTMPLGDGYGLFLIRVRVSALDDVLALPGRRAALLASLRSMSEAMVRYKNLAAVRARILAHDLSGR